MRTAAINTGVFADQPRVLLRWRAAVPNCDAAEACPLAHRRDDVDVALGEQRARSDWRDAANRRHVERPASDSLEPAYA